MDRTPNYVVSVHLLRFAQHKLEGGVKYPQTLLDPLLVRQIFLALTVKDSVYYSRAVALALFNRSVFNARLGAKSGWFPV